MFVGPFSGNFTSDRKIENTFQRFDSISPQNLLFSTIVWHFDGQKIIGKQRTWLKILSIKTELNF